MNGRNIQNVTACQVFLHDLRSRLVQTTLAALPNAAATGATSSGLDSIGVTVTINVLKISVEPAQWV